jgi:hypothetical protein
MKANLVELRNRAKKLSSSAPRLVTRLEGSTDKSDYRVI